MTAADALKAVQDTFPTLDSLASRFGQAEAPAMGSTLAADDRCFPALRLSELARGSLAAAWDHFTLVRLTVDNRRTFVTATGSVIRGALVASAFALWMLAPKDRTARVERGLIVAEEWMVRRIQFQRGLDPDLDTAEKAKSASQLARLQQDLGAIRAKRTTRAQLNTTDVIEAAARVRFGDDKLVRASLNEWRRLGGDAHGVGWQLMLQTLDWDPPADAGGGLAIARITGKLDNIAEPHFAAWHIFGMAIRRFDALCAV